MEIPQEFWIIVLLLVIGVQAVWIRSLLKQVAQPHSTDEPLDQTAIDRAPGVRPLDLHAVDEIFSRTRTAVDAMMADPFVRIALQSTSDPEATDRQIKLTNDVRRTIGYPPMSSDETIAFRKRRPDSLSDRMRAHSRRNGNRP